MMHDVQPEPWMARAACRNVAADLFFPGKGEPVDIPKAVCRGCESRPDCLNYALDNGIHFGVWGGLTEKERKRIRRNRRAS